MTILRESLLPDAIFLDTSVFVGQGFNFGSTAISTFVDLLKYRPLTLVVPRLTESEIRQQIRKGSIKAIEALSHARQTAPLLERMACYPKNLSNERQQILQSAIADWETFKAKFSVVPLDYSRVDLDRIMRRYFSQQAPFGEGKKQKEFPDAIVVDMLLVLSATKDLTIAVVSADNGFKDACREETRLFHFSSLPRLTEILLTPTARIQELRSVVETSMGEIEAAVRDEAQGLEFEHAMSEYEVLSADVLSANITDFNVVALGDGECTIAFDADIEFETKLSWREWGQLTEDAEQFDGSFIETTDLSGSAKLVLGPNDAVTVRRADLDKFAVRVSEVPQVGWARVLPRPPRDI